MKKNRKKDILKFEYIINAMMNDIVKEIMNEMMNSMNKIKKEGKEGRYEERKK